MRNCARAEDKAVRKRKMTDNLEKVKEGISAQKKLYGKLLELGMSERKAIEEKRTESVSDVLLEKQNVMAEIGKLQEQMPQDESVYSHPEVVTLGKELASMLQQVMKKEKENHDLLLVHMEEVRQSLKSVSQKKQINKAYQVTRKDVTPKVIDSKK